jgi:hypothetical protein
MPAQGDTLDNSASDGRRKFKIILLAARATSLNYISGRRGRKK